MLKFSLGTARYGLSVGWIILEKSQTTLISRYFTNNYRSSRLVTAKFMILLYATNGSACTPMPSKDVVGTNQ